MCLLSTRRCERHLGTLIWTQARCRGLGRNERKIEEQPVEAELTRPVRVTAQSYYRVWRANLTDSAQRHTASHSLKLFSLLCSVCFCWLCLLLERRGCVLKADWNHNGLQRLQSLRSAESLWTWGGINMWHTAIPFNLVVKTNTSISIRGFYFVVIE